jgi:hypothetical protein
MSETDAPTPINKSSQSTSQNYVNPDDEIARVERVPWSELAQEFAETWGRADPRDPQPESVEVVGINGSGKSLWVCKAIQERMIARHTPVVMLQSKPDDATVTRLGWPIITNGNVREALKERWSVFWPQTNATGLSRRLYQADAFRNMLDALWHKDANTVVVFDDVGYIQSLTTSDREPLNPIIEMYLREGRSTGITNMMVKQRPQGAKREMHSETYWTVAFAPKDEDDKERFAQLFGNRKRYMPVFDQMDMDKHEFLIKHYRTGAEFISWVDTPLRPLQRPKRNAPSRSLPKRYIRMARHRDGTGYTEQVPEKPVPTERHQNEHQRRPVRRIHHRTHPPARTLRHRHPHPRKARRTSHRPRTKGTRGPQFRADPDRQGRAHREEARPLRARVGSTAGAQAVHPQASQPARHAREHRPPFRPEGRRRPAGKPGRPEACQGQVITVL